MTQCDVILARLREAGRNGDGYLSSFQLARASGSLAVHSRISELRGRGHRIERTERSSRTRYGSRRVHYYRLAAATESGRAA